MATPDGRRPSSHIDRRGASVTNARGSRLAGTSSSTRTLGTRDLMALRPARESPRRQRARAKGPRREVTSGIACFCGERFAESQALEFMLHLRAEVGDELQVLERRRARARDRYYETLGMTQEEQAQIRAATAEERAQIRAVNLKAAKERAEIRAAAAKQREDQERQKRATRHKSKDARMRRVVELHSQGLSLRQIAKQLKIGTPADPRTWDVSYMTVRDDLSRWETGRVAPR